MKAVRGVIEFPGLFEEEYIARRMEIYDTYEEAKKEKERILKVFKFLDENIEYIGITGEELQDKYNYFNDEVTFGFSWRGWGGLMAAFFNSSIGKRKYCYMDFYM